MLRLVLSLLVFISLGAVCGVDLASEPTPPLSRIPFDAEMARSLQKEWAKTIGADATFTNSVGMKLVVIPAGRFDMDRMAAPTG